LRVLAPGDNSGNGTCLSAPRPRRYLFVPVSAGTLAEIYRVMIATRGPTRCARRTRASPLSFAALVSTHESARARRSGPRGGGRRAPPLPSSRRPVNRRSAGSANISHGPAGLHLYFRDCRQPLPYEQVRERVRTDLIQGPPGAVAPKPEREAAHDGAARVSGRPPTPAPAGGGGRTEASPGQPEALREAW